MEISRFPNKLKFFRRCSGYSQKKVARLLGHADTSSLSRWESGIVMPGIEQVFRLARIYHTHPHELFGSLWVALGEEYNHLNNEMLNSYSK